MPTAPHESPMRTCVGCRVSCAQDDLLRLQLVGGGDAPGRVTPAMARRSRTGRSAYVCPRRSCLDQAIKRRAFTRAFSSRSRSRSVETIDPAGADALWTAVHEQIRREIELYRAHVHPRRRSLERLLFELSCPPLPPVRPTSPDRRARSNGQGGSSTHG